MATAGAGTPCRTDSYVAEFYDCGERLPDGTTAGSAYAVRTGRKAPPGSVVFPAIGQAIRDSARLNGRAVMLGALGEALHAAGARTSVFGSADLPPDVVDRSAAVLVMDSRGIVYAGRVGRPCIRAAGAKDRIAEGPLPNPPRNGEGVSVVYFGASTRLDEINTDMSHFAYPASLAEGPLPNPPRNGEGVRSIYFGASRRLDEIKTDMSHFAYAASLAEGPLPNPPRNGEGVSVVYFGASTRLDEMKPAMSAFAYATRKMEILRHLDSMLHRLLTDPRAERTTLILVSFSPPKSPSWDQLTPVVIYPAPRSGLLSSATTRTPGLIAASDFAPTVLSLLDIAISDVMAGNAAHVVPDSRTIPRLGEISARVTANQRLLAPAAVAAAAIAAFSLTGAAVLVAFRKRPRRLAALCKIGMVTVACYPAAMLLAVLAPAGTGGYLGGVSVALVVLVAACVAAGALFKTDRRAQPIVIAYAITCLAIVVDAATGCNLCMFSALSSYQITGMRFYGIGNEYAAVLISMAALAALFATQNSRSRLGTARFAAVVGAVVVLALGSGSLGANYGATAAAVVTFGLMWAAVRKGGFGARDVVIAFLAAVAVVVMFAALDWKLAGKAGSHAARATGLAGKLGGGYLVSIAVRKLAYNLRTTFSVKGISTMLAFTPFVALWFWGVRDKVRSGIGNREHKMEGKLAAEARKAAPSPQFSALVVEGVSEGCLPTAPHSAEGAMAGVKAVLIGAVTAFLLNDSGIVFGATMIGMTVLVLLYSLVEEAAPCPQPSAPGKEAWEGSHPDPAHSEEREGTR